MVQGGKERDRPVVGDDSAREPPRVPEQASQQVLVCGAGYAVDVVVGIHHRADPPGRGQRAAVSRPGAARYGPGGHAMAVHPGTAAPAGCRQPALQTSCPSPAFWLGGNPRRGVWLQPFPRSGGPCCHSCGHGTGLSSATLPEQSPSGDGVDAASIAYQRAAVSPNTLAFSASERPAHALSASSITRS